MRRVGQMEELQNLATFLMADGCEWLTGETIAVDGGGYLASGSGGYFAELDKLSDADWERMRAMIKATSLDMACSVSSCAFAVSGRSKASGHTRRARSSAAALLAWRSNARQMLSAPNHSPSAVCSTGKRSAGLPP